MTDGRYQEFIDALVEESKVLDPSALFLPTAEESHYYNYFLYGTFTIVSPMYYLKSYDVGTNLMLKSKRGRPHYILEFDLPEREKNQQFTRKALEDKALEGLEQIYTKAYYYSLDPGDVFYAVSVALGGPSKFSMWVEKCKRTRHNHEVLEARKAFSNTSMVRQENEEILSKSAHEVKNESKSNVDSNSDSGNEISSKSEIDNNSNSDSGKKCECRCRCKKKSKISKIERKPVEID